MKPIWAQVDQASFTLTLMRVVITSAASTPDDLVQAVVERLRLQNPALTVTEEGEWEHIEFREPKKLGPDGAVLV